MAEFLEEQLPVCVRMGASYADSYNVEITTTADGSEYRRLVHPYPVRVYNIFYTQETAIMWDRIISLYHRCYGMFAGFRVKAIDDFSTNNETGTPTYLDQPLARLTSTTYQLQKEYGTGNEISIGKSVRTIFKPVTGTVKIGLNGVEVLSGYTVDYTTGIVTSSSPIAVEDVVTGGCEFDIPCRFNSRIDIKHIAAGVRETSEIELIELLNP